MRMRWMLACLALAGCGDDPMSGKSVDAAPSGPDGTPCGDAYCTPGFHCEFDACIADQAPPPPPPPPTGDAVREDPLTGGRYVFVLERTLKRLVRIDSGTLAVGSFTAGLSPMDLGIIAGRELSVLLDGLDLVEVLDHRVEPPRSSAYETAHAMSHLAVAPFGNHVIAYFDWDDPRAQERQLEPGNINQVSVLYIGDEVAPMGDEDARHKTLAVGFLPRDVRFAADGSRAAVIGKDTITPIDLQGIGLIGAVQPTVHVEAAAAEILINAEATRAVARYLGSSHLDVVALDGSGTRCFEAGAPVLDAALLGEELVVLSGDGASNVVSRATLDTAGAPGCTSLPAGAAVLEARQLALEPSTGTAVAYAPSRGVERLSIVPRGTTTARLLVLEKAIAAIAFAGDGEHALLSHLKAAGTPAWDPLIEDPEVSVDKAYGVSWLNLATGAHRLAVNDAPFGTFAFVPGTDGPGATYQAVLDERAPAMLRVSHEPGFSDRIIELAAEPMATGYLGATARTYVTQTHPWGRVTFLDPTGDELRHVTGFALTEP